MLEALGITCGAQLSHCVKFMNGVIYYCVVCAYKLLVEQQKGRWYCVWDCCKCYISVSHKN